MNLAEYRQKYGKGAIMDLHRRSKIHYSQLYGTRPMSFERCQALAECEPELDAVEVYNELRSRVKGK